MLSQTYWQTLRQTIREKKGLVACILLTTVLCFGFTVTNFSIGTDDPARTYYFYTHNLGSMIQQGRLLHLLLNTVTRSIQFIPFFPDFVGAGLYALSALLYAVFFRFISEKEVSLLGMGGFSCVYISSSILAEKFIYQLDVIAVMLSFCFSALGLMYGYCFVKEKQPWDFCKSILCVMVAISSYESFPFLYICGVMAVFIWQMTINRRQLTFRQLLQEGLQYAAILLCAMAVYYGLVYLVQALSGQRAIFERWTVWTEDTMPMEEKLRFVCNSFRTTFIESLRTRYLPVLVFCFFSAVGGGLSLWVSLSRKSPWPLVCYAGLLLANLIPHLVFGEILLRAAQTLCFFSAFIVWLLVELLGGRKIIRQGLLACVVLLVFVQSADMNRWFYNDYVRYQKEAFVIHTLATQLLDRCDVTKPVVFSGSPANGYLHTQLYPGSQVIGKSVLYWSATAFNDPLQPFPSEIFRMHGYDFVRPPTEDQYRRACQAAEDMPPWPQQGSLAEFDDFIVVNFQ